MTEVYAGAEGALCNSNTGADDEGALGKNKACVATHDRVAPSTAAYVIYDLPTHSTGSRRLRRHSPCAEDGRQ